MLRVVHRMFRLVNAGTDAAVDLRPAQAVPADRNEALDAALHQHGKTKPSSPGRYLSVHDRSKSLGLVGNP